MAERAASALFIDEPFVSVTAEPEATAPRPFCIQSRRLFYQVMSVTGRKCPTSGFLEVRKNIPLQALRNATQRKATSPAKMNFSPKTYYRHRDAPHLWIAINYQQ